MRRQLASLAKEQRTQVSKRKMLRFRQATLLRTAAVLLLAMVSPCEQYKQLELRDQIISSCRADFPDGTLDLSPLDEVHKTAQPRFRNFSTVQISGISYHLSYNPCSGLPCNSDTAAAVCATDIYGIGLRYDVASQTGSNITMDNGNAQIRYTSSDKGQGREFVTVVSLVCASGSSDNLSSVEMSAGNVLKFQLSSRHCCLTQRQNLGWSPGDFILLFFFLIIFLYFVTFLLINGVLLKRSGLDLLPHRHVWMNLGLLVKDGCLFTFSTVRGKISQSGGYTEIR